jgi:hypothetical protein
MAIGFTVLFIAGCATSNVPDLLPEVDLKIEQLPDSGFAVEDRGAISVAYQMAVRNRSADVLTLRKVEMQTSGRSPYTLRNEPVTLNETIEPGKEVVATFTMWSYSREQRSDIRRIVWVSGVAYFDSTKGSVQKTFTQSFREP